MKFFINKKYITIFLSIALLIPTEILAKDRETQYIRENISNYFLGIVSANYHRNNEAFKYLKKAQSIKEKHSQFNIEFIRTLVTLEKFKEAINFSKNNWKEDELFYEADLILGINYFLKKDYKEAEKFFERLNKISRYNLVFDNFIGNILISWSKASQKNEEESYSFVEKIPDHYYHLKNMQEVFLQCYFDDVDAINSMKKLINNEDYDFSRYNFFLVNQLLHKNKINKAKLVIERSKKKYNSNLLIRETSNLFLHKKNRNIKNFFDCKKPKDSLAEFFYVIANLYSSEKDYEMSNFYLKISLYLNENFLPNKALLAENFYYQKKYEDAKKIYQSIKSIGSTYAWHASKSIASILLEERGKKHSIKSLEKDFRSIINPSFENYYELANFYKENEYYKDSIKYYSLTLKNIKKNHSLIPKILDRRGTSYERLGEWEKAEKDLTESLKLLPEQPHVLNYLAYTWVDKGINLDKGLEMLKKAAKLRADDGYIIDSLGWAYYAKKNYSEAEKYLQRAVQLLPFDPIINDHYADALWMLNKNIQARYVWKNILSLDSTEKELKDSINKKLIFGINKKL